MSTSFSLVPDPADERQTKPFPYAEAEGPLAGPPPAGVHGTERRQAAGRIEQAAHEAGRQEGEARVRAACEQQVQGLRDALRQAVADFARERTSYFEKVEVEVVELALAMARKILHREAQVDPLLLAGIVRVALNKLESGTKVTVRVAPPQVSDWRSYFARWMDEREVPEVVEDTSLPIDQCVLKTAVGTTALGLEVQLKEIEQGLMDLMAQRPPGNS